MLLKRYKTFLLFISFALASSVIYRYYSKKKRKETRKEIHEVIMFSPDLKGLKISKHSRSMVSESLDRLLYYMSLPRHSLDICMYVMTNLDLTNAVLKLHYKGVKIRFIIDADMAYSSGSHVRKLEKHGVPIRWMKATSLMHHKFCLIDTIAEETSTVPFVIAGSLNWTNQGIFSNWEDVIVTSQMNIVDRYRIEYEKLWNLFKPIV